jgi:hypothetical protein
LHDWSFNHGRSFSHGAYRRFDIGKPKPEFKFWQAAMIAVAILAVGT